MFMTPLSATEIQTYNANGGKKAVDSDPQAMQDRFLKLLVEQLKNQDPMNPMENAEMTSQIAQINTVTGIQQLNSTMSSITTQFNALQKRVTSKIEEFGPGTSFHRLLWDDAERGVSSLKLRPDDEIKLAPMP